MLRLYYCLLWSNVWFSWVTLQPTVFLGVKAIFIKRSQRLRPTIKRIVNQRWSCHGMRGSVGDIFGSAPQKMTHAFFQICGGSFLTPPPLSSGSSQQWKKRLEADCCSLTRVSTQKLRWAGKRCSAGMPKCSQKKTQRTHKPHACKRM